MSDHTQPAGRSDPTRDNPARKRAADEHDARTAQRPDLWKLTPSERVAAFWNGELSFAQCLEWSRGAEHEVPLAADGEFLYIACRTPEWLGD